MKKFDEKALPDVFDDDDLFMAGVICGEHELLYLDTCLREIFGR